MSRFVSSNEIWDQVYESFDSPYSFKGQGNLFFKKDYGEMHVHQYNTGFGIKLFSVHGFFNEDVSLEATKSDDSNFLCINYGSTIYMEDAVKKQKVKWGSGVCWNGEQHKGHKCNILYQKNKEIKLTYILLNKELFKETVCNTSKYEESPFIHQSDYINVKFNNYINLKQKALLDELSYISNLHCNKLQELYLESKLLDLVYTSVNSMQGHTEIISSFLNKKDIECLHKAKEIILSNIVQPPSIKELSRKSAINEFKLKKGFKELFGTTVYGMVQEQRLNKAKYLLEKNDINISEVTKIVGYKNIAHFSKIFKEKFGYLSSDLIKKRKYY